MRSMFPFQIGLQSHCAARLCCVAALVLGCNFDEVSLGGSDGPGPGSGACIRGVDGVVEGDVMVSTQGELDELAGCSEVAGSLFISANRGLDLAPLGSLRLVRGRLSIDGSEVSGALDSLRGLERLEAVGELFLRALDISTLAPLRNLAQVRPDPLGASIATNTGSAIVYIRECHRLIDLTGLESLLVWDELSIDGAQALESLRGLVTIRQGQSLFIRNAPSLRDVAGLGGGAILDAVRIIDTAIERFVLEQPLRLTRLEFVDNPALVSVEGLGAIQSVEELVLRNNDRLEQLPELPYLDANLATLTIVDNDALRSIPRWIDPENDNGSYQPWENLSEPGQPDYFFPQEFAMAEISGNPQLSQLALPHNFRYGGNLRIHDNPNLTTIDLGLLGSADDVSIVNNAVLSEVNIPVLETVDALHVVDNPSLPPGLFENVQTFSTEMRGNLQATAP